MAWSNQLCDRQNGYNMDSYSFRQNSYGLLILSLMVGIVVISGYHTLVTRLFDVISGFETNI